MHALYLLFHRLRAVNPRTDLDNGSDARRAHFVEFLMAALDGGKHIVPLAFDVRPVRVELGFESRLRQYRFTCGDIRRERYANPNGNNAQINDDFHGFSYAACARLAADGASLGKRIGTASRVMF